MGEANRARRAVDLVSVEQRADVDDRGFELAQGGLWHTQVQRAAIANADAQPRATGRELVEGRHGAGDDTRVSAGEVRDTGSELDALGCHGQRAEQRHDLARDQVRVGEPEDVVAELLGESGRFHDLRRRHAGREANAKLHPPRHAEPAKHPAHRPRRGILRRTSSG